MTRSSSSRFSTATKRNGASAPSSIAHPAALNWFRSTRRSAGCWREDVVSPVDVPSFDRSNVDGFAVVAEDTFGASEETPRSVLLIDEEIHTGVIPTSTVHPGEAALIATGGMVPRGADAVVMVEDVQVRRQKNF